MGLMSGFRVFNSIFFEKLIIRRFSTFFDKKTHRGFRCVIYHNEEYDNGIYLNFSDWSRTRTNSEKTKCEM